MRGSERSRFGASWPKIRRPAVKTNRADSEKRGASAMNEPKSTNKVGLIGTGMVGASFAYSLMQHGLANELVLIDMDTARAEGEAMDLNHGLPFVGPMRISAGDYPDLADADVVVICAGANQRPGQTRLDLLKKNAGVFRLRDRRRAAHGRRGDLARPAHGADGR